MYLDNLGIQGAQGVPGSPGQKGDTGDKGLTGPKGEVGPQGNTGQKGTNGLQGPTGSISGPVGGAEALEKSTGTVYVRWGHDECPPSAALVYAGIAGGAHWNDSGGGSNPQCLPLNPIYSDISSEKDDVFAARMYGGEYQLHRSIGRTSHQSDVPCAVCYSNRSTHFMLPARYICPSNWTTEYSGYLMAGRHDHRRSQFTCVDGSFKTVPNSAANVDGLLFYPVEGRCGALPCPLYNDYGELSCAVCTK